MNRKEITADDFEVLMDNPEMQAAWDIYEKTLAESTDRTGESLPEWDMQLLKITFLRGFRCGHLVGKYNAKVTRN